MILTIARHGETIENKNKIVQGQWPGELTELGKKQAADLAKKLKNHQFDVIYCSDLKRAVDTAEYVAKYHPDAPVIPLKGLREISFGDFEGKFEADVDWLKPVDVFWDYSRGGGETNLQFYRRITSCVNQIYSKHASDNALVVTHGWVIKVLQSSLENLELEKIYPIWLDNCSAMTYEINSPLNTQPQQSVPIAAAA